MAEPAFDYESSVQKGNHMKRVLIILTVLGAMVAQAHSQSGTAEIYMIFTCDTYGPSTSSPGEHCSMQLPDEVFGSAEECENFRQKLNPNEYDWKSAGFTRAYVCAHKTVSTWQR